MKKIRYAVVGLGHIAQVAVLPGFKESPHSELVALVSGSSKKLKELSKKYKVERSYDYDDYDECLKSGKIDAVYIALPNHLHESYAVRAAEAGIHVLCEKPIEVSSQASERMIRAARKNRVKLMIAYRLHFDPATLKAIQIANSGKIGDLRYFTSEFGYQLRTANIRMMPEEGGGPLNDIGIYCINAVRNLFRSEPTEVYAIASSPDKRFAGMHETVTAVLRFPQGKMATFTCSFGSAPISRYRIVGTRGDLSMDNAYEYVGKMKQILTVDEKKREWTYKAGDQFSAEIEYFSNCVRKNKDPEPSGQHAIADVKIIEALYRSIEKGSPISMKGKVTKPKTYPKMRLKIKKPAHREPKLVGVEQPSRG